MVLRHYIQMKIVFYSKLLPLYRQHFLYFSVLGMFTSNNFLLSTYSGFCDLKYMSDT